MYLGPIGFAAGEPELPLFVERTSAVSFRTQVINLVGNPDLVFLTELLFGRIVKRRES